MDMSQASKNPLLDFGELSRVAGLPNKMSGNADSSSNQSLPMIIAKGPMPCAINKIAGYFRNQIVLQSPRADLLQKVLGLLREAGHLATNDRIAVDVDPVSLL